MKTLFVIPVLSLLPVILLNSCSGQYIVKGYEEGIEKTVKVGEALLSCEEGNRHIAWGGSGKKN